MGSSKDSYQQRSESNCDTVAESSSQRFNWKLSSLQAFCIRRYIEVCQGKGICVSDGGKLEAPDCHSHMELYTWLHFLGDCPC
jgi:hypothetical protein